MLKRGRLEKAKGGAPPEVTTYACEGARFGEPISKEVGRYRWAAKIPDSGKALKDHQS